LRHHEMFSGQKSPQSIRYPQIGILRAINFSSSSGDLLGLRYGCCTHCS
jgi:hypothetical protein